jgi:hypothetical protein
MAQYLLYLYLEGYSWIDGWVDVPFHDVFTPFFYHIPIPPFHVLPSPPFLVYWSGFSKKGRKGDILPLGSNPIIAIIIDFVACFNRAYTIHFFLYPTGQLSTPICTNLKPIDTHANRSAKCQQIMTKKHRSPLLVRKPYSSIQFFNSFESIGIQSIGVHAYLNNFFFLPSFPLFFHYSSSLPQSSLSTGFPFTHFLHLTSFTIYIHVLPSSTLSLPSLSSFDSNRLSFLLNRN